MDERCDGAEHAGIAHQNVEPAPALVDRGAEPVDGLEIRDVAGHERRLAAFAPNGVVEFLERSLGSRHRDHVRTLPRELQRDGAADAA